MEHFDTTEEQEEEYKGTERWFVEGRKIIPFGYGYADLLRNRKFVTTVRLVRDKSYIYEPGEEIVLRAGKRPFVTDAIATVVDSYLIYIKDLSVDDLAGSAPDTLTPEALRCVLGNIAKGEVPWDAEVQVIHFTYLD
mgnify:CR=1 FL=1